MHCACVMLSFRNTMDHLNQYMEEYKFPVEVRDSLRAYIIYCRYAAARGA
jgi:hypothetical protein